MGVLSGRWGGAPLGPAFALDGAVRNVSLLWSATIGITAPEGEAVTVLSVLWTFTLPVLLGLRGARSYPLARAIGLALVAGGAALLLPVLVSATARTHTRPHAFTSVVT